MNKVIIIWGCVSEKRDALGERVYQRALHVVSEIERCTKATDAIAEGNFEEMGRLMYQSHVSLRQVCMLFPSALIMLTNLIT